MIKLDDNLLQELGLGSLPPEEKKKMLAHIYETLEMRVGMALAKQMSDGQLNEFEQFIKSNDEAGALRWLESNFPNYRDVVAAEFEKLKAEVKQSAPQIVAASNQAQPQPALGQQPQPAQPYSPQQYAPQAPAPQQYAQPQPAAMPMQQPYGPQPQTPQPQPQAQPGGYSPQPQPQAPAGQPQYYQPAPQQGQPQPAQPFPGQQPQPGGQPFDPQQQSQQSYPPQQGPQNPGGYQQQ